MAKILRLTDRVSLKLGDVTFILSPLSNDRKLEIGSCTSTVKGEQVFDHGRAQHLYIKHSLKEVRGLEEYDGSTYELEFEGECLSDDCVSEIFMLEQKEKLMVIAWQLLNGIPAKIYGTDDKILKGVKLEVLKGRKEKK